MEFVLPTANSQARTLLAATPGLHERQHGVDARVNVDLLATELIVSQQATKAGNGSFCAPFQSRPLVQTSPPHLFKHPDLFKHGLIWVAMLFRVQLISPAFKLTDSAPGANARPDLRGEQGAVSMLCLGMDNIFRVVALSYHLGHDLPSYPATPGESMMVMNRHCSALQDFLCASSTHGRAEVQHELTGPTAEAWLQITRIMARNILREPAFPV